MAHRPHTPPKLDLTTIGASSHPHHRHQPLPILSQNPGLHRQTHQPRQNHPRNPPLSQTVHRPTALPTPPKPAAIKRSTPLLTHSPTPPEPDLEIIEASSPYGSGEVRAKLRAAGHRAIIKPIGQRRNPRLGPDQFTRDDFVIDHDQNRVTCPAGNTATIGAKGQVRFGVVCTECPHRRRCTTSKRGRYLTIHPHDRLLTKAQHQWKQPKTVARYNRHRPSVERIIAWVVANGNRKLRYRGIKPNRQRLGLPPQPTLRRCPRPDRRRSQTDPALPSPDQRESGTLPPNPPRGMGLQTTL